jgi:hypothetical protein
MTFNRPHAESITESKCCGATRTHDSERRSMCDGGGDRRRRSAKVRVMICCTLICACACLAMCETLMIDGCRRVFG